MDGTKLKIHNEIIPPLKPIITDDMNRRCQIDIIDLQAEPDGQWKYILNYQDHHTKVMRVERDDMCKAVFDQSISKWLTFSMFVQS